MIALDAGKQYASLRMVQDVSIIHLGAPQVAPASYRGKIVLLSKGFEIEMYTGTPQGDVVGLSERIVRDLDGFVREPDSRNVEYTTAPFCCYDRLLCAILRPRRQLRGYLQHLGNYTLIPYSTLS